MAQGPRLRTKCPGPKAQWSRIGAKVPMIRAQCTRSFAHSLPSAHCPGPNVQHPLDHGQRPKAQPRGSSFHGRVPRAHGQ
eukprot:7449160-Pyramimonas_sp.AAC.1